MARGWSLLCTAALAVAISGPALAQGGDASRAADLFNEGLTALDAGEFAKACGKFEESLALVPRPSTVINLAKCHEKQGHLVQAHGLYKQALERLSSDDPKLKPTMELLDALTKRLPRLSIKLPPDLPTAAQVQLDGKTIEQSPVQGIPVDPGQHALLLTAPGRADVRTTVTLVEGQQLEITLNVGEPTGAAPLPTGTGAGEPPPPATAAATGGTEPPPGEDGGGSTLTTAGFVIGGVGLASFVAAGITGGILLSRDSDIEANCPNQQCNAEGADLIAGNDGLIAVNYVTWIVGIAGVGVGAVLIGVGLSSEGESSDSTASAMQVVPLVGPGFGGVSLSSRF